MKTAPLRLIDFRGTAPLRSRAHCIFREEERGRQLRYFPVNQAAYAFRNLITDNIWLDEVQRHQAKLFVDIEIVNT